MSIRKNNMFTIVFKTSWLCLSWHTALGKPGRVGIAGGCRVTCLGEGHEQHCTGIGRKRRARDVRRHQGATPGEDPWGTSIWRPIAGDVFLGGGTLCRGGIPRRTAACTWPMGKQGHAKGLQAVKGMCWRLYTERHREGGMPGTEQAAAVRNSYTRLQLPAWHFQRKWDGLSLTHRENEEVDGRKGSGEVLSLSWA